MYKFIVFKVIKMFDLVLGNLFQSLGAVSYTHLDVYKRQIPTSCTRVAEYNPN